MGKIQIKFAKLIIPFFIVIFSFSFIYSQEQTEKRLGTGTVQLIQDEDGMWRITVNGQSYFIKGIEYSADIVGKRPDVNEWMWSDLNDNGKIDGPYDSWIDFNRNDYQDFDENPVGDFALLKAMGCNTIRIYHSDNVNKEILRDLYKNYGIRVIMGNYLGAYTKGSDANWEKGTDYTDSEQRAKMINSVIKMVEEHKNEPYILMWMLGNENDVSGSHDNSTKTNTNANLYPVEFSKFVEEVCQTIKKIDVNHPVGICNATTRFVKYYAQYAPSIDVLGFNQYLGPYGFGVLWRKVNQEFDRPVLVTEYGCDAYNQNRQTTDEEFQLRYHKNAWKDIEQNSYWGKGAGNAIGGVVYCWLDKWWLIG